MGGAGSGNHYHWWRSGKKKVVEDCLTPAASRWMREGILRASVMVTGTWRWTYASGKGFSVSYSADTLDPAAPFVRLSHSWVWPSSPDPQSADYRVRLT